MMTGEPRPSLQERYGEHAGYVAAVRCATEDLVRERLLLPADAANLVSAADASNVLR
jgi:Alpha/beta hydrolase domain